MTLFSLARRCLLFFFVFQALSLVAQAVAPAAPTNCVAAGIGYTDDTATIYLSWNDNSTDETQWVIQYSVDGGAFGNLGPITSATTAGTGVTGLRLDADSNTTYRFKIYAFNGTEYSIPSNESSVTISVFTLVSSAVPGQTVINLSWPNIQNESGYRILFAAAGDPDYSVLTLVAADVTTVQVTAPLIEPTKTYFFIVQPYVGNTIIENSNVASSTVDGMTSKTGTSGTPGSSFSHTFTQLSGSGSAVISRNLTGVPSGLSFNSSTGVLSGVYPALGNYALNYSVAFANGGVLTQTFHIRVRPPAGAPLVGTVIPAWNGVAGASRDTPLAGTFSDPEAESAVRVSTTLGDMDFILFDSATPATVTNFMNYVSGGAYTDVAFHRSIYGFVIQGGGFKGAGTGSNFSSVITNPPVVNEPGIANVRGTVSMAKVGGDPDSATSQFFVSLGDNRANLDYQNGGFTVFGRVAGNGMSVADAISNLPTETYNLFVDGSASATPFGDFPMNAATAPVSMDQTKLLKIHSVSTIPTIRYSITGNTRPSVASASIVNGQLHLVGLAGGQTTITVTATDLDNLSTSQEVVVTLSDTFSTWASRNLFPGGQSGISQNPDADSLTNLQEYAFFGDPAVSSQGPLPMAGKSGVSPAPQFLTLTFPVRKFTTDLLYVVEANEPLAGMWTPVWSSADGFLHPQVVTAVDEVDRTVVTIKDTAAIGASPRRFLRTRIVRQ